MIKPIVENLLKDINKDPKIQQEIKGLIRPVMYYIHRLISPYMIGLAVLLLIIIALQIRILKKLG
jgi:hypothetical protein